MSVVVPLPVLTREAPPPPPQRPFQPQRRLIDSHGRTIRDLRLSITDKCNFRCVYCMDPDVRFAAENEVLSVDELIRIAGVSVSLGITHIRLTGGEPTVHPELEKIIKGVADLGVADLSMTTNGSLIDPDKLTRWKRAGLKRLTFSMDSVEAGSFRAMTRSKTSPDRVRRAIADAIAAGLGPVKVNAVIVRGRNEDQIVPLARLASELGFEMRFIEFMPLDSGRTWDPSLLVPASEVLEHVREAGEVVPLGKADPSSTSETYVFADGRPGRIGMIAPVTRTFCGRCSRLRITADGKLRPCLFSLEEFDVRPLLRGGATDTQLEDFMLDATWTKQAGHGITSPGFKQPDRPMSAIGG